MKWTLGIFLFLIAFSTKAQDPHVTQKFNNPLFVNPAQTGNGEKVNRLSFFYRDQWRVVPVKYVTSFLNYDRKLFEKNNNKLAGGVQFLYDRAGDGALSSINPTISMAYTRYFNEKKQGLSGGFNVGYFQRSIDESRLQFDSQFDGTNFDPNLTSGEVFGSSAKGVNLGFGLNFMTRIGKLSQLDLGASLFNPHRPSDRLTDDGGVLNSNSEGRPIRYGAYITSELFLNNKWSLTPSFHYQTQEKAQEFHTSLYFSYYTRNEKTPLKWSLGGGYRFDDAILAYTGLKIKDFQLGFSYDINTSGFQDATNRRGAYEASLIYEWEKEKEIIVETPKEEYDTVYITLIDSNQVKKEEVIEPEPEPIVEVPEPKPYVPLEIELLQKEMPLKLFFDNDRPDPKTNGTKSTVAYSRTLNHYLLRRPLYIKQMGAAEADQWFDVVRNSRKELDTLVSYANRLLQEGYMLEFTIKGYTSPLAPSDYNINLSSRRIASAIMELQQIYGGVLMPYFNNGNIKVVQSPLGETYSPEYVSDQVNNQKKSVFSREAAYERRVEIIAVKIVKR